ncbi:MAG: DUF3299 domain-containing protein [Gammaproteobacteria bacterium]|nr:DUF3299 domain-containing protein [Gammaproteobacteria bacterium]
MSKTTLVLTIGVVAVLALLFWLLLKTGLISLPSLPQASQQQAEAPPQALTLQWPDLIPPGYNPDDLYLDAQREYDIEALQDDDPRVVEVMKKMEALANASPIKKEMNGKLVRLPGYVVPLETDGKQSSEFLLVPYFGACIHVPPPPANQTVHVVTSDPKGARISKLFEIVWVEGVIKTEKFSSELADAGYVITASKVEPYEDLPEVEPSAP